MNTCMRADASWSMHGTHARMAHVWEQLCTGMHARLERHRPKDEECRRTMANGIVQGRRGVSTRTMAHAYTSSKAEVSKNWP